MGVEGLWRLVEPAKRVVALESLSGLVLAVDLSIWIHQAMHGNTSRGSERNAHLKILFFRICKLLFHGIRPVFVFDGPNVPYFKQMTLSKRRLKRAEAAQKLSKIQKKLLKKIVNIVDLKEERRDDIKTSQDTSYTAVRDIK